MIKSVYALLKGSAFLRNVATLVSGSALAQLIALACAPILTRLYTPEDFGLLGVFMAVSAVAATIATLRYDMALVLPKEDASAWCLLRLAGTWTCIAVLLAFFVLFPLRDSLADLVGAPGLARYFVWLPLLVLTSGWLSLATHWAIRKKRFRALSTTSVSTCVLGNGYKIGGGLIGFGGGVLIVGTFIQQLLHLTVLAFQLRKEIPSAPYDPVEARAQAREHRSFPLYRMPQDGLNTLTVQLPNIILAVLYSPAIIGFYLLAQRVLQAPTSVIRESVRSVMYQRFVEAEHQDQKLYSICVKATLLMAAVMLPFVVVILIWGPLLFEWIFGQEWLVAGQYARWLVLWVAVSFCNVPAVVAIPVMGLNRFLLVFEVLSTSARIGVLLIASKLFEAEISIALFVGVACASNVILILSVLRRLRKLEEL